MHSPCQPISPPPLCLLSLLLSSAFNIIKCPLLIRNSNELCLAICSYLDQARIKSMSMLLIWSPQSTHIQYTHIKGHRTKCHPQLTTHISIAHKQLAASGWGAAPRIHKHYTHSSIPSWLPVLLLPPFQCFSFARRLVRCIQKARRLRHTCHFKSTRSNN